MANEEKKWYEQWKTEKETLLKYFDDKQYKQTKPLMDTYSQLFIKKVYDLNLVDEENKDVDSLSFNDLTYKPVNVAERIQYVRDNLTQYHAFIQLDALFDELIKLYAKVSVLRSQPKRS